MSWQDWGDVRHQSRGRKDDLFGPKGNAKWKDGDAIEVDSRVEERRLLAVARANHKKAMAEQKRAEEKARKKQDEKAKKDKEKRDRKEARKRL